MGGHEKIIFMYEAVHGPMHTKTSAHLEVEDVWFEDQDCFIPYVICTKGGNFCWRLSREEILFDYLTRDDLTHI